VYKLQGDHGASNTGVDDVRESIENVRYQPAKSRFKIYIIDEVHMLSTSAFNALLKTLEEPPPHVKFVFATTDPHKVPHTIHSRCQRYDFKRIPLRLVAERLADIARNEGVTIGDRALFAIAREGEGSMRDAQSLLDQVIAFAGKKIGDEDVVNALGVADRKLLFAVADAVVSRNPARVLELVNELHDYGYDMRRLARELLEHFRNLSVARLLPDESLLADLSDEERADAQSQCKKMSTEDLDRAFRLLIETEVEVARVPYPKLVLEMALIKLSTMAPVVAIDTLLERLDDLERRLGRRADTSDAGQARAPGKQREAAAPRVPLRDATPRSLGAAAAAAVKAPETEDGAAPIGEPPAEGPAEARTWGDFLQCVARDKVTLLPYLQKSIPPRLDGTEMALSVPKGYYFDYLVQRDHAQLVEELAGRFFGRPFRVVVRAAEPTAESGAPPAPPSAAELHATALEHPVVRAAVEILGGEVREVRNRRRERGTS
jgi:DNA polymerase-3 subunit gamma/tau